MSEAARASPGADALLSVEGVHHFHGESQTLWGVDLRVPPGARLCLMGRNGVGKTTLLRCIMGLERIRAGVLRFGGEDMSRRDAEWRPRAGIGYVPQGREIFPRLTVEENLRIGLGVRAGGARAVPDSIFELFPVLADMRRRRGGDLSGGQQQQLAIGRALVLQPRLLILDEPTEGIQPSVVQEIADVLVSLNQSSGLTVLVVEQKLAFARRVADCFSLLDKGRVMASGSIDALDERLVSKHLSV